MKRPSITTFVATAIFAVLPLAESMRSTACSQDITITIKQDSDKDKVDPATKTPFTGKRPAVDVAILLDTSNSMDGLISQAKSQLWQIVQQFGNAEKAGKTPQLRVSVFEYGNSTLPASEGYIRQVVQLTDDLDKVSEALFSLTTQGGDEYCGTVINEALDRLDWSSEPNAFKAIFIAGNEPFTQGSVDYITSCKKAIQRGVVVNTIHCGNYAAGVSGKWQHGAQLAEGEYLNIDQDRVVVHIKAPQDKIIIELNRELNKTYLWYGAKSTRQSYHSNQLQQDANAIGGGGGGGRRFATKAGKMYSNRGRDLVDSMDEDGEVLSKMDVANLPDEMQKMTTEQRMAHVKTMAKRRGEIKKKILAANAKRELHVAKIRKEQSTPGSSTLGDAVSNAIQKQLKKSGFEQGKK